MYKRTKFIIFGENDFIKYITRTVRNCLEKSVACNAIPNAFTIIEKHFFNILGDGSDCRQITSMFKWYKDVEVALLTTSDCNQLQNIKLFITFPRFYLNIDKFVKSSKQIIKKNLLAVPLSL